MKSSNLLLIPTLLTSLTAAPLSAAESPQPDVPAAIAKEKKAKPYPLDFCLVSDEKFEGSGMTPFEMVREAQTIKFCCKNCVKDFNKDPKKFLGKLTEEVKKREAEKAKK